MAQRFRARVSGLGVLAPVAFAVALFCCAARSAFAVSCAVVRHPPLSDPDKALLAADYTKAESLYRSALAANPGDADLTVGLVHALLREQKVQEAADTVKAAWRRAEFGRADHAARRSRTSPGRAMDGGPDG